MAAEDHLVEDEEPEVQQGSSRAEARAWRPRDHRRIGGSGALCAERREFLKVVQIVGYGEVLVAGKHLLGNRQLWREEVVTEEQLLEGG